MFPNPHDAVPLPPRPSLEAYKKRAKDLVKAANSPASAVLSGWSKNWIETLTQLTDTSSSLSADSWITRFEQFVNSQKSSGKLSLTKAQFILARAHGFESWPGFSRHLMALARANSPAKDFEAAADAIVTGDIATLKTLLGRNPNLVRARSPRRHRATLLHYVAANGVEHYRQRTPANAVAIAKILLDRGAEADATADIYGPHDDALALVATSIHPEQAGLQESLMSLLLARVGPAAVSAGSKKEEKNLVASCLANGRLRAAEFLAGNGAALNFEAAAGLGRLDIINSFFDEKGKPSNRATRTEMERGLFWACEYGRNDVVEFLWQKGVSLDARSPDGQSPLHWAVIGGQPETVKLLLSHGANLEARNSYGGTVLGQALWSAVHDQRKTDHLSMVRTLIRAGAHIDPNWLAWLESQSSRSPAAAGRIAELLGKPGGNS
jgi:Ankyrin repeats (3 copies)